MRLRLLRHGRVLTGGARYEETLLHLLTDSLKEKGISARTETLVAGGIFRGLQNLQLLRWAYSHADADVNIVVARAALPALLRNPKAGRKVLMVLHNFDRKDDKGIFLRMYYNALFRYLRWRKPANAAIIAVAPYFQKLFGQMLPGMHVFLVPNLFDTQSYLKQRTGVKDPKKILLGLWSPKNDPEVFVLARMLTEKGYKPYFCSLDAADAGTFAGYKVMHVPFDEYLAEMASSLCTVTFSGVLEGWSRVTHESLLVGTPVIGFDRGGLGDQLKESGSIIVQNAAEALEVIEKGNLPQAHEAFIKKYDLLNAPVFLEEVVTFLTSIK